MANAFITPGVIAARGIATLYNTMVLAGLVWRDFDADFRGKQGDTITVRKPAVFTAEDFDRSRGITLQDVTEDSDSLRLDRIANVSVAVTDEEMTLEISDFQEQILTPAAQAIAQKVDGELAEALVDAASAAGQAAVIGGDRANSVFRGARAILSRNKYPIDQRYVVLSPEATSAALGDELLIAVDKSGSTDGLRNAILGRLLGFETYESQVLGEGPGDRGSADGVAFHRSAITLAVRPLQTPRGVGDGQTGTANLGGLSMRVVYAYNLHRKQDELSLDVLYGIKALREDGAVELDFAQGS